eukprot:1160286-Pelagomonas_calceolata.AAC.6
MTLNCYTSTKCGCSRHKGRAGGVGSHRLFHRLQRAYRRMVRSQPLVGSQAAACTEAHRRLVGWFTGCSRHGGGTLGAGYFAGCSRHRGAQGIDWLKGGWLEEGLSVHRLQQAQRHTGGWLVRNQHPVIQSTSFVPMCVRQPGPQGEVGLQDAVGTVAGGGRSGFANVGQLEHGDCCAAVLSVCLCLSEITACLDKASFC